MTMGHPGGNVSHAIGAGGEGDGRGVERQSWVSAAEVILKAVRSDKFSPRGKA